MRQWWSKVRAWMTGRAGIDNDMAEEVRSHVEMETDALVERGMNPEAARTAAHRHFGTATAVTEHAHEAWTFVAFESLLNDVRYGFRAMRRSPAFSLVVILTFALGVGVNTAIFSVVNAVLIKPLPYPDSERLVHLREANAKSDFSVTWGNFNYWRDGNRSFEEMAAFQGFGGTLTGRGDAVTTFGLTVTAPYYALYGMHPLLGRLLGPQDDLPGAPALIVLSRRRSEHRRSHPDDRRQTLPGCRRGGSAVDTGTHGLLPFAGQARGQTGQPRAASFDRRYRATDARGRARRRPNGSRRDYAPPGGNRSRTGGRPP